MKQKQPRSKKAPDTQKPPESPRTPEQVISGFAVYLALALFIAWSFKLSPPIAPQQLADWLGRSIDPLAALVYFCLASSAAILTLFRLGIDVLEVSKLKLKIPQELKPYVSGLPMWALVIFFTFAMIGFLAVYPSCQPPVTIIFETSKSEDKLHPSETLNLSPGEGITITARSTDPKSTLHCKWEYAGSAFQALGAQNGCQVSAKFSEKTGDGFITVSVAENFCSQSSIFSLHTVVASP